MTKNLPTREEMFAAQQTLKANGWEHTATLMSGDKGDANYGLLYARGEERFWLNKDTIDNLPKQFARLSEEQEHEARYIHATYCFPGRDIPENDSAFEDYMDRCTVLYKDDCDTGESFYQVVDEQGKGDGMGQWYPVKQGVTW